LPAKITRLWLIIILLLLGGLIVAPVKNDALARGRESLAQDNIVISEFRSKGPAGSEDVFVEIFNPTTDKINIGGWLIISINSTGKFTDRYTFPDGQELDAGQHFLVTGSKYSGGGSSNGSFTPGGIPGKGGIAITLPDKTIIDKVGMSTLAAEGTPLAQLTDVNASYERKPGGDSGNCYDSNNNAFDFKAIDPIDPQDSTSQPTICDFPTGVPTRTPTTSQTRTPTFTPTISTTPTESPTATISRTPTITVPGSPTATPYAPSHMVISEFRTQGIFGADDEFVELYNPTGAAVNLSGWSVKRSSSCGTSSITLFSFSTLSGTILQAGQHYLAATTASQIPSPDTSFSPGIADDGGLVLVNASGTVVDAVGMCISTLYREGTNLVPLSGNNNQSYERRPGGSTSCYDLDNNAADFVRISPARPQNKANPIVMCSGVTAYTPTRTPTITRTPTPLATSFPGNVVINEFLPHPFTDWNANGVSDTGDEYIELINLGTSSISLKNWKLDNGFGGPSAPYTLPDAILLPRQIIHFYHSISGVGLSDGGGTVRLLKPDGRTADIFNYPLVEIEDQSWCRLPDGTGSWTFTCSPTPGRLNKLFGLVPNPQAGKDGSDPFCLVGKAPLVILSAECTSSGTKIWGETGDGKLWLGSRGKWAVFVE
jgi:hypothetical protein